MGWIVRYAPPAELSAVAYVNLPLLDAPDDSNSGESPSKWKPYKKTGSKETTALYIDVDTSKSKFHGVPAYVSCVAGESHHWSVTGAASIFSPTRTSFRMYLDKALSSDFARRKKWRVNYIAYQGTSAHGAIVSFPLLPVVLC